MAATIGQRLRDIIGDSFGASIVEQNLEKALREIKESASAPTSTFYDPLQMFIGKEWLEKGNLDLRFKELRYMARSPIIASIVQTRINQVAAFCTPQRDRYELGFKVVGVTEEANKNLEKIKELEEWVYHCGIKGYGEANLETLARKTLRDSLVLDQMTFEVVDRRNGTPAYMVAVDAETVRKTAESLKYGTGPDESDEPHFVQIIDEIVKTRYTERELVFGVRNPSTEIKLAGYGTSELEILVRVVTAILNAERYNYSQLSQGGIQKGVFIVRGDANRDQFESFKRDFREAVRSAAKVWQPPVLQVSKDAKIDWTRLDETNRDMEYAQLFDFLVKQACALYQIDPIEVNWQIGATGQTTTFESSKKDKVSSSQERGLRPLLVFFANQLNTVIQRIDPLYRVEFKGLTADREADNAAWTADVQYRKTLNEVRGEMGLKPLLGGDMLMSAFHVQELGRIRDEKKEAKEAKEKKASGLVDQGADQEQPVEGEYEEGA